MESYKIYPDLCFCNINFFVVLFTYIPLEILIDKDVCALTSVKIKKLQLQENMRSVNLISFVSFVILVSIWLGQTKVTMVSKFKV